MSKSKKPRMSQKTYNQIALNKAKTEYAIKKMNAAGKNQRKTYNAQRRVKKANAAAEKAKYTRETQKERQKTLRTTAIAGSASQSVSDSLAATNALAGWSAQIGANENPGTGNNSSIGQTNTNNSSTDYPGVDTSKV